MASMAVGFVSGALATPVAMTAGAIIARTIFPKNRSIRAEDNRGALGTRYGIGALTAAVAMACITEVSPFATGFKVALTAWSAFAGFCAGALTLPKDKVEKISVNNQATAFLVSFVAGAAIGTAASLTLHPAVGCIIAGAVSKIVLDFRIKAMS